MLFCFSSVSFCCFLKLTSFYLLNREAFLFFFFLLPSSSFIFSLFFSIEEETFLLFIFLRSFSLCSFCVPPFTRFSVIQGLSSEWNSQTVNESKVTPKERKGRDGSLSFFFLLLPGLFRSFSHSCSISRPSSLPLLLVSWYQVTGMKSWNPLSHSASSFSVCLFHLSNFLVSFCHS